MPPIFAICLGAQTLAHALGARVGPVGSTLAGFYDSELTAAGADEMVAEIARPAEPPGGGRGVDSPVSLVIETFGASIESETVRE